MGRIYVSQIKFGYGASSDQGDNNVFQTTSGIIINRDDHKKRSENCACEYFRDVGRGVEKHRDCKYEDYKQRPEHPIAFQNVKHTYCKEENNLNYKSNYSRSCT